MEVLPEGYVKPFPGYLDILLTYPVLKKIFLNPQANSEWKHKLSSVAGIYAIKDSKEQQIYIGSASGAIFGKNI